ncbi:Bacteriophage protein (plasmid) [Pararobbsia alpina]
MSIRTLAGVELLKVPANQPWTEALLFEACNSNETRAVVHEEFGADVFLGERWIGGTEI